MKTQTWKSMTAIAAMVMLGGCVSAAKTVVTAPFKVVGQVADWSTTSEEEAGRNRGRALRERDERLGELHRDQEKALRQCRKGSQKHCERAEILGHEMDAITASPY